MKVNIYQVYFDANSQVKLDSGFIPYDNSHSPNSIWREYGVMKDLYDNELFTLGLNGVVSWKFRDKTALNTKQVYDFINNNDGYDVYLFNPWPELSDLFDSSWQQGQIWHKSLIRVVKVIFEQVGYNPNWIDLHEKKEEVVYCNFWVATPSFWKAYMDFTKPIYEYIEANKSDSSLKEIFRVQSSVNFSDLRAYIMERLINTFIALYKEERQYKTIQYPVSLDRQYDNLIAHSRAIAKLIK
ncbi:hypothetical protein EP331_00140 [bacterium]|nr:MAG: hypothetical protein EP331_00140 [bacterium]